MKREIVVIGAREEIVGYKLAGVQNVIDMEMDDLLGKIPKTDCIIFLTHNAHEKYGLQLRSKQNIVFEIPQTGIPYTRVGDIIRDTIGFDLRK